MLVARIDLFSFPIFHNYKYYIIIQYSPIFDDFIFTNTIYILQLFITLYTDYRLKRRSRIFISVVK